MTTTDHGTSNIVLTGFMGTGKSTVGRVLATRLAYGFVDTDEMIESRHGPIEKIFAEQGEDAFRAIERGLAVELAESERLVIATGGGLMLDPVNVASLSRNGRVFCLVARPESILRRLASDESRVERPLLAVPDPHRRIVELLADRGPRYRMFTQVDTDGRTPEAIADAIAALTRSEP